MRNIVLFTEIIWRLFILLLLLSAIDQFWNLPSFSMVQPSVKHLNQFSYPVAALKVLTSGLLLFRPARKIGLMATVGLMIFFTCCAFGFALNGTGGALLGSTGIFRFTRWPENLLFNLFFLILSILLPRLYKTTETFLSSLKE